MGNEKKRKSLSWPRQGHVLGEALPAHDSLGQGLTSELRTSHYGAGVHSVPFRLSVNNHGPEDWGEGCLAPGLVPTGHLPC